jgi:hypothetical protein
VVEFGVSSALYDMPAGEMVRKVPGTGHVYVDALEPRPSLSELNR